MSEVRRVEVDYLARVEGEGSMKVLVRDGTIEEVEFGIFEPPRFFEAFMVGRQFTEAPDITARICGICPIAYQMSSVHAMEDACGVTVDGQLRELRRLIYCGEWIESHGLHIYLLHAPDFLGYESAVHMAADHRELVEQGLQLKKVGNDIVTLVGGREIHPINVKVGGFYKLPAKADLEALVPKLEWAREAALKTVEVVAGFDYPDIEIDYEFVSVCHPDEYPFSEGNLVSNRGIDVPASEFNHVFTEEHVERSNALQSRVIERGAYHVGPMARYALNYDKLPDSAKKAAASVGLGEVCLNPFKSIIVRAVEMVFACEEALRIIEGYDDSGPASVPVEPRAGVGHGATEAPRGMLYHRYEIADDGSIVTAQIAPPTAQNQLIIENDLRVVLQDNLHLADDDLSWRLEQSIRNYDPCISCATHFLKLEIDRG
ncbi:MAG: Ni/Fe hydrogenase subunit alpha [Acidimicrobiia bacterium]|nr:Ni/Fe hydrogenase subunit alpha [Acidimicrobiia bacterium]